MKADRIVSGDEYDRLQTMRKLWWTGWAFAALLAVVAIYQSAKASIADGEMCKLKKLEQSLLDVQKDQAEINVAFDHNLQREEALGAVIIEASDRIKERQKMVDSNRGIK